ncbi:MAG TPA: hypothetical protein ENG98_00260 [Actinobacteria bacterium]|nr:hypothetical protein [Actinomycetota bacterium]
MLLGFAALLLSSCSNTESESPQPTGPDELTTTVAEPTEPPVDSPPSTTTFASTEDLRTYVAAVLDDGFVSAAEMDRVYGLFIVCLEKGGLTGEVAYDLTTGPGIVVNFEKRGDDHLETAANRVFVRCNSLIQVALSVYSKDHPTGDAERALIGRRLFDCLTDAFPDQPDLVSLLGARDKIGSTEPTEVLDALSSEEQLVVFNCREASEKGEWRPFGS